MAKLTQAQINDMYRGIYAPDASFKYPNGLNTPALVDEFYKDILPVSGSPSTPPSNGKSSNSDIRRQREEQIAQRKAEAEREAKRSTAKTTPVNMPGQPNGTILGGKNEERLSPTPGQRGTNIPTTSPGVPMPRNRPDTTAVIASIPTPGMPRPRPDRPGDDSGSLPVASGGIGTYTVKEGDTLSGIAQQFYGNPNAFRLIAQANGISNPNRIKAGQKLQLTADASPRAQAQQPVRGTVLTPVRAQVASQSNGGGGSGTPSSSGGGSRGSITKAPSSGYGSKGGTTIISSGGQKYDRTTGTWI